MSNQPAILLLEDGSVFYGEAVGAKGTALGEVCFNTGMTGYQEVFTDPSYFGQLLTMTSVHIGNYGAKQEDQESNKVQIAGLICKNFSTGYSRPLADQSLQSYCEEKNLVGISNVDTRKLVLTIRDKGAMNGIISSEGKSIEELKTLLSKAPDMEGLELASKVSTTFAYDFGSSQASHKVAVLDYGTKSNILDCMVQRDIFLRVFPAKSTFAEILDFEPDGIFLSNGPGDPAAMDYAIETVREVLKLKIPVFGICLGHQLLSLALDIPTYKMHNGHRGANHPVLNLKTGRSEITSQNHGFNVVREEVEKKKDILEITHVNLNDNTVEGMELSHQPGFSVQFHPEASPGPHDSRYLFDRFKEMLESNE